jgi:hypothetical protein
MTTLLVSTVRRHTPSDEPSGYIYAVDLEKSQVVQRSSIIEPAYREVDDNPRGGMRGSKGDHPAVKGRLLYPIFRWFFAMIPSGIC